MTETPHHSSEQDAPTSTDPHSTRRTFVKAAGAGAIAAGVGSGVTGSAAAQSQTQIPTPKLEVDGNVLVDQNGDTVTLRGLNVIDPRRADTLAPHRGRDIIQQIDAVTDPSDGWYPRVIRLPMQPCDIAEIRTGYTGGPVTPGEFSRSDLETYLDDHVDEVVDFCEERGVYVILDYHRHWTNSSAEGENPEFDGYWATDGSESSGDGSGDGSSDDGSGDDSSDDGSGDDGSTDQNLYPDPKEDLQDELVMFWEIVADRYGDRDHTLFEVYNEPTEPGIWGDPWESDHWVTNWVAFAEFVQPAIDTIAERTDNVQLLGSPSWTQVPEGIMLTEEDLPDYADKFHQVDEPENLALTYHIYPGHGASRNQDWGGNGSSDGDGVFGVHEEYPLVVTEFGWDNTLMGSRFLSGTVSGFGEPFMEWLESSPAISWTAWCADPLWDPTMFDPAFERSDADLGNPYDAEIPQDCPETPCEWDLLGEDAGDYDDHMGAFIKEKLAEYRDDNVPGEVEGPTAPTSPDDAWENDTGETWIELGWDSVADANGYVVTVDDEQVADTDATSVTVEDLSPGTSYEIGISAYNDEGSSPEETTTLSTAGGEDLECRDFGEFEACDATEDGLYRDFTGDGEVTTADVSEFQSNLFGDAVQENADSFNFSGSDDGSVSHGDVVALFQDATGL